MRYQNLTNIGTPYSHQVGIQDVNGNNMQVSSTHYINTYLHSLLSPISHIQLPILRLDLIAMAVELMRGQMPEVMVADSAPSLEMSTTIS